MRTTGKSIHHTDFITVVTAGREPITRLGITVTKKVGTAVTRNKIKRQVREFFRLNKARLPNGIDIHIIAKNSAATKESIDIRHSLHRLFDDLTRRFYH